MRSEAPELGLDALVGARSGFAPGDGRSGVLDPWESPSKVLPEWPELPILNHRFCHPVFRGGRDPMAASGRALASHWPCADVRNDPLVTPDDPNASGKRLAVRLPQVVLRRAKKLFLKMAFK